MTWPTLYKQTTTGAVQQWTIHVEPAPSGGEESATIVVTYGHVGGKMQTKRDVVRTGKNTGKKNETSPLAQARLEAEAKWRHQRDRSHYSEDPSGGESAAKRAAAPMLAHVYADYAAKVDWQSAYAQPKFDGHRGLLTVTRTEATLVSRKGLPITTVPHILRAALAGLRPTDGEALTYVNGELYAHGVPVTTVGGYLRKAQPGSETLEMRLYDVVCDLPYEGRLSLLQSRLRASASHTPLRLAETVKAEDEATLMAYQRDCIALGYEGAMLRHGAAGYAAGKRSASLLKVKTFHDGEFIVIGVKEGRGDFAKMAIFRCQTEDGVEFDVTAPGTHEEKRRYWRDHKKHIGRELTVKYAYLTPDGAPFHPVAKCFREDV